MVTIKDIAKESGFSVSVVSRALNPKPDQKVKATTEKVIRTVAEQLGYRPNHTAAFLQRGRNPSIGVFLPRKCNSLVADLVLGISDVARSYGLMLDFHFGFEKKAFSDFLNSANENRNVGIISYMPYGPLQKFWHKQCREFIKNDGKVVFINNPGFHDLDITSVTIDNYSGGEQAAKYLIGRKCDKLLCVDFEEGSWQMDQRTKGFRDFSSNADMQKQVEFCSREKINLSLLDKLKRNCPGPLGVFTSSDYIVFDLIREFYHANRINEVGKEFMILGFDNLSESCLAAPAITTFCQDFQRVGSMSMQKMANMIIKGIKEKSKLIQPELIIRESA
jgi:DNA-binding LacI/PurR family transcriptional regulator